MESLSPRDRVILAFEAEWHAAIAEGRADDAIREKFGLSPSRYFQLLNAVVDNPAALVEQPMQVRRLLRMRAQRSRARASRQFEAS